MGWGWMDPNFGSAVGEARTTRQINFNVRSGSDQVKRAWGHHAGRGAPKLLLFQARHARKSQGFR